MPENAGAALDSYLADPANDTCTDFGTALKKHANAWNILLIDSEGPLVPKSSLSLCKTRKWNRSYAVSIFWMVELMQSWFLADRAELKEFYGDEFRESALTSNPHVETIAKQDVIDGLTKATKGSQKGDYFKNKTLHGPRLLEQIDPQKVSHAAPNCRKLFDTVRARLQVESSGTSPS